MDNGSWDKTTTLTLIGLFFLLAGFTAFYLVGGLPDKLIYLYTSIAVAVFIIIIGIVYAVLAYKGKIKQSDPDYRSFFLIGIMFMIFGMSSDSTGFLGVGGVFLIIGLANKNKWKKPIKWSELPKAQRNFKIAFLLLLALFVLIGFIAWYISN